MLQQIADEHPLILEDPAPVVAFEGFGDSCLDLVLRCYLPNLDNRLKVVTQLHLTIDSRFKEAGIEIAFPTAGRSHSVDAITVGSCRNPPHAPAEITPSPQSNASQSRRSA